MARIIKRLLRTVVSRYAISAVLIGIEIVLIAYMLFGNFASTVYLLAALLVIEIVAFLSLINKDANPEYKVPWVFVIMAVPVFGPLLYALFYHRRMSRGETKLLGGIFDMLKGKGVEDDNLLAIAEDSRLAAGKVYALMNDYTPAELYRGSRSDFYPTGEKLFADMVADLRSAEKYIFLEYFIIDEGALWDEIHTILKQKAKSGVEVRLLYDDIGCAKTLPPRYERTLRREGIKAYRFNRVTPHVSAIHHNRDHRKICIIDGRLGYTGGVNIADEYVNLISRFGYWKDGGIRLSGDAVKGLLKLFLSSWDYTCRTISDYEAYLSSVKSAEEPDGGYYLPFGTGPAPAYKRPVGKNAFLNLINQAERYVYITTPYLIIDYELTEALSNAALRGVDVRIVTPGVADKKIVKVMTKSSYPHLIDAGVKIYEYKPGFIHEKTFVCDDAYAVVGTINFDYRSLVHHFECAVWMYKTPTVEVARDEFLLTLNESEKMDKRKSRLTLNEWLFKNVIRIFAPLL